MDQRSKFYVMSCGRILPGFDMDDVGAQVAELCMVSRNKARTIVTREKVLKKNLDLASAKKYQHALEKMGIEIRLLEMHPSSAELHAIAGADKEKSRDRAHAENNLHSSSQSEPTEAKRVRSRGNLVKTLNKLPDFPLFHEPNEERNVPTAPGKPSIAPHSSGTEMEQAARSLTPWHGFAMQLIKARQSKNGAMIYDKIAQDYKEEDLVAIGQIVLFVTGIVNTIICGSRGLVSIWLRDMLETGHSCRQRAESHSEIGDSNG